MRTEYTTVRGGKQVDFVNDLPSAPGKFYHQPVGQDLRQHPVELVKALGRIEHPARPGGRQGPRHYLLRVAVGQRLKGFGVPGDLSHVQKLRGHGTGAHGGDGDLPAFQLLAEAPGKAGDIGLGAGIHRHPGIGAEGGDRADVDDPSPGGYVGNRHMGHRREGRDVQVRHPGLEGQLPLPQVPQIAAPGVVDEQAHLRLFRRQLLRQAVQARLVAQVQGQYLRFQIRQLPGQLRQTVRPAGDEPHALDLRERALQLPGELLSQSGGGAGDHSDPHQCFSGAG